MNITVIVGLMVAVIGILMFVWATPTQKQNMQKNYEAENPPIINIMGFLIFFLFGLAWFDGSDILPGSIFQNMMPHTAATITSLTYMNDPDGDYYRAKYSYNVNGVDYAGGARYRLNEEDIPREGELIWVYYLNIYPDYTARTPSYFIMLTGIAMIFLTVILALILNLAFGIPIRPADF